MSFFARSIRNFLPALALGAFFFAADVPYARADEGAVDLRNGVRLAGNVIEVTPTVRVVLLLPDGRTATVAWSDVAFVYDGPRRYDAAGNLSVAEGAGGESGESSGSGSSEGAASLASPGGAPPSYLSPEDGSSPPSEAPYGSAPPMQTAPTGYPYAPYGAPNAGVPYRLVAEDPAAWARYQSLPRRGGSICMVVFGGLAVLNAASLFASAVDAPSGSERGPLLGVGVGMAAVGGVLLTFGFRRLRTRRHGLQELRAQGFYVAGIDDALTLRLDVASDRAVPTLSLRF